MRWTVSCFIVGWILSGSLACAQSKTWELNGSGQWTPINTAPAATMPTANPTLDRVHDLYLARKFDEAHDLVLNWLKTTKTPDRDRGIMLMAQIYFARDQRVECFYELDELMDTCPDSQLFFPALQFQFRVAEDYLDGHKDKLVGLPIIPMEDIGIEMLYRVQERAPGAPIAERALRRTADYYYHDSQFDLAADAYGAFMRIYPRSTEVPQARLRQAYSNFAQFRGPRYNATPLLDARAEFVEIQNRTPELAREYRVSAYIERIDELMGAKILADAQYYVRVGQPTGAVFLLRSLVQRYPNSRDADTARDLLKTMPAYALATPPPPSIATVLPPAPGIGLPTTQPSKFGVR